MAENSKNHKQIIFITISIVVLITIIAGAVILFRPKTQYKSKAEINKVITALECESSTVESPFFHIDTALSEAHKVKLTFSGGTLDKMSYTYTGNFPDSEAEKKASAELHAKYNEYMNTTIVNFSDLSPNFSNIDNQLIISLFLDEKTFTAGTAKLMFLDGNAVSSIKKPPLTI